MARRPSTMSIKNQPHKKRIPRLAAPAVKWFASLNLVMQFAVVFAIFFGIWFVANTTWREVKFLRQKPKYAALEQHMQQVMDDIAAATGKPFEVNHGTGCSRTSAKFDEGLLNCNNYFTFSYEVNSDEEGRILIAKIVPVYSKESSGNDFMFPNSIDKVDTTFSLKHNYESGFSCDLDYDLTPDNVHNDTLGQNYYKPVGSAYAAEFSYACGGYPVKSVYKFYP